MPITKYVKDSLFNAPKGSVLVHSASARGVWGAGIAKEFRDRFPQAYHNYHQYCKDLWNNVQETGILIGLGKIDLSNEEDYGILTLIVSKDIGYRRCPPRDILTRTAHCLGLLNTLYPEAVYGKILCMPKINSGLFAVDWEETEKILEKVPNEIWVYDPNMEEKDGN